MADNLETRFSYSEDSASRKRVTSGIDDLTKAQKAAAKAAAAGEVDYASAAKVIDKLGKEKAALLKVSRQLAPELDKEAKAIREVREEAEQAALSFGELADKRRAAIDAGGSGFSGDVASSAGGLRGAVDVFSGGNSGALGKSLEGLEAIGDVGEFLPQLTGQFKTLFDAAKSGTGFLGGLAGGFQALIPALGGTGAAVAAVVLPVAALTAAAAPLVIALQMAQKQSEQYVAALQREADVREAVRDASREASELGAEGDIQGLVDARQAIFDELAARSQAYTEENNILLQQNQTIRDAGWGELPRGTRAARDEQKKLVEEIGQDITILTSQLAEYDTQLVGVNQEQINVALNAENLAIIQEDLARVEDEGARAAEQLTQAQARVAALDEQRASMIENRAQQETFAAQNEALEARFANEDQAAQNRELYSELESIASDGKAKLVAIETDLANLRVERAKAIGDVEAKGNQKIAKLNSDYFSKHIKETQNFARQTERIESDNAKARKRLLEDLTAQLNDAERNNDVIAFLSAQREGAKQLRDQSVDANEAEKRRIEDFALQQEEAAQAQSERLAEAIAQINEERAAVIASYDEKRAALVEAKAAEKQAIAEASAAAIARYTETEAREAQAAERQAEREALREEQQDILFQQQLQQIETRKQKELEAVNAIGVVLTTLAAKAATLNSQARQIATQSAVNNSNSNSSGSISSFSTANYGKKSTTGFGAFANEGVVDRPTIALVGDKPGYSEAMINFKRSEGLPATLAKRGLAGGGMNITIPITMNNTVGDIATASMLNDGLAQVLETALYDGVAKLLENGLNGVTAA